MKRIVLIFILINLNVFSQEESYIEEPSLSTYEVPADVPIGYFSPPMNIPLQLSGTFGELRSNHFHAGLDIRTQQREGIPVYATADGYVNRIKVAHYGYGKALYLQHPNGYSTLYGHLQKYAGAIEDFVKHTQYSEKSYEIEVFPKAGRLPVKKGDLIGYSGNSGSSGGPHLHFEIRDNASRPMNPKMFGIEIEDTRKPLINSVFVYPIGEDAHANQDANPQQLRLIPKNDGSYVTEKIKAFGLIGFGVSATDQQNAANNRNGVFKIETHHNGNKNIEIVFDKISFSETRYLNRYIDYGYYKEKKSKVQKLFIERNNPLSIFKYSKNNGYISIEDGFNSVYTMDISDFNGNTVSVSVPIEGAKIPVNVAKEKKEFNYLIPARQGTTIKEGKFSIYIPPNSLYEDAEINVSASGDVLEFHKDVIPVHTNMTISVDISDYKADDLDKVYLGPLNYRGVPYYNNTTREGNILSTNVRNFGKYGLGVDTIPPVITPVNFSHGKWISSNNTLEIKIKDFQSGIKGYRATINDKWVLMEYEYKKDLLTFSFDDDVKLETENILKLIVTDNVGNNSKFEATFYRK